MDNKISISREPDPRGSEEIGWVDAQSYVSLKNNSLVRGVHTKEAVLMCRSEDNGKTWQDAEVVARKEYLSGGRAKEFSIPLFYLDPDNGLLVRFVYSTIVSVPSHEKEYIEDWGDRNDRGPRTVQLFYEISRDGGNRWKPREQVIEKGTEFNSEHWSKYTWYGKGSLGFDGRYVHKRSDGTIVVPCYLWHSEEHIQRIFKQENRPKELWVDAKYFLLSICLFGRWKPDLTGFEWESGDPLLLPGGYTNAGTCGPDEPTIAFLDDSNLFIVVRTSTSQTAKFKEKNIPVLRYCAVSSDGGKTWHDVRPLTYSDGSTLYSPSSYSEFIRSSKSGKWYWIANILSKPTYGQCDPRYPLQIAELEQNTLGIKKETVSVIEDKKMGDPDLIRFSNFRVYEERETKDFILLMTTSYSELQEGFFELPRPSYRYRIHISD